MIGFLQFFRWLPPKERKWAMIITGVAIAASSLPYVFGWIIAGTHHYFMADNPLGSADTNVYFSFMKQAEQGKVFAENLFTSEPQRGSLLHPLWLLLGWVAGLFRLSIPFVYHAARVVLGIVFLVMVYRIIAALFADTRSRLIALVLLAFSSGIGTFFSIGDWNNYSVLLLLLPADQWVSESNTFLTLMHSPLFILSQILLVSIVWSLVRDRDARQNPFWLGCLVFLLGLVHPYDLVTVVAVAVALILVRAFAKDSTQTMEVLRHSIWRIALVGLFAIPPIIYYYLAGKSEPAIGLWSRQNVTESPLPHSYIIGYGAILVFAVAGFVAWRKSKNTGKLLVLAWTVTNIVLLYLPVQINRRFSNGLHIPLVLLATVGITILWGWAEKKLTSHLALHHASIAALGWTIGIALFFSNTVLLAKALFVESHPADTSIYALRSTIAAMDWLEKNAPRESVVMSGFLDGNLLPARTGLRVYVGHGHQTINWGQKVSFVTQKFFRASYTNADRRQFLINNNIAYLLYGPDEKSLGNFQPQSVPYLVPVFSDGDVSVYRVEW